ncbi:MAG TPA: gluconeogenesis factor YvcK family protein [Acidobacteriaceae bacterium]|jgi:uncharacterized cofD-like protein|nr:gluconeogenesis factor YvcK family protein [Acidobacteriaceae bacterium]
MGGGTGLSTLLRGLKYRVPHGAGLLEVPARSPLVADLTAIVTVTDDGGSSGRLRRDFNMLPPGDLRNCMVALSEDEGLIARLFRHRFRNGGDLGGHNFGNLFIAALNEMTGDFAQSIRLAAEILATRGHILPVTAANVTLAARMEDGSIVRGETSITASRSRIVELALEPADPTPTPTPETLNAIAAADLITVGPGSLYTSMITNLLVRGIPEALGAAQGTRVFVCNLMTQANESLHLSAAQHIERIYEHTGRPIFDYALVNTAPVSQQLRDRYAAHGAETTVADIERIEALGIRCVTGNFADEGDVLRHAADRVTDALLSLPVRAAAAAGR